MKISTALCKEHYRLLVLGGGTGGCAVAARFQRLLKPADVAIVESSEKHYYQPGFTMVGGGIFNMDDVTRNEQDVMPRDVDWLKESVTDFYPIENRVQLSCGRSVSYDFLVVALGLELRYDLVSGLSDDTLSDPNSGVCSIYSPRYVTNVRQAVDQFESGIIIFTLPKTPIKCAGAPQKIMYLSEERLCQRGKRSNTRVLFNAATDKPFTVSKYSDALRRLMEQRGIEPNFLHNLVAIDVAKRLARFEILDSNATPTGEIREFNYSLLHVAPPCSPIKALRETAAKNLTDAVGWVNVNGETLRSVVYPNVFAIGDCSNVPTSKTMAAISSQLKALTENLKSAMENKELTAKYNGYTSCPLVVDSSHVILAEFDGRSHTSMETFPYDQSRPSRFAFWLKRCVFPWVYWSLMLDGKWEGPARFAKIFRIFKFDK